MNGPLPNDWPNENNPTCGDKCYVCSKSYMNDMLPVVYEGAVEFLDSKYFSAREFMPYPIVHDDADAMPNRLWESAGWKKKVFGIKGVSVG